MRTVAVSRSCACFAPASGTLWPPAHTSLASSSLQSADSLAPALAGAAREPGRPTGNIFGKRCRPPVVLPIDDAFDDRDTYGEMLR